MTENERRIQNAADKIIDAAQEINNFAMDISTKYETAIKERDEYRKRAEDAGQSVPEPKAAEDISDELASLETAVSGLEEAAKKMKVNESGGPTGEDPTPISEPSPMPSGNPEPTPLAGNSGTTDVQIVNGEPSETPLVNQQQPGTVSDDVPAETDNSPSASETEEVPQGTSDAGKSPDSSDSQSGTNEGNGEGPIINDRQAVEVTDSTSINAETGTPNRPEEENPFG